MDAGRARAVGAVAHRAGVRTVVTLAVGAFVVVHALLCAMLAMDVPGVEIVHVVAVNDGLVTAAWAVGVPVLFRRSVLQHWSHDSLLHVAKGSHENPLLSMTEGPFKPLGLTRNLAEQEIRCESPR
jgi:hypothetical protein